VAAAGRADPLLVQWGPFVVFAAIILWMYWRIAYIPGGQPIGALEKFVGSIGKRLRGLFGRRPAPGLT
jgi:lipopolysaccharide export system permease protein